MDPGKSFIAFLKLLAASIPLYIFVNAMAFTLGLGQKNFCHGDGQAILFVFASGFMASLSILGLGVCIDLKNNWKDKIEEQNK